MTGDAGPVLRYAPTAQALHWATVALLAVSIPVALVLHWAPPADEPLKFRLYTFHESIGLTVWLMTLARVAFRAKHAPPPPLASWTPLVRRASKAVQGGLYAVLLTMPIVGWAANSALGFPPDFWWLIPLPPIAPSSKALGFGLLGAHRALGYALILLLVAHVGGALRHQLVLRDATFERMLPRGRAGDGPR